MFAAAMRRLYLSGRVPWLVITGLLSGPPVAVGVDDVNTRDTVPRCDTY